MVEDYGLKTVQEYMYHIRNNAENSVRNLLRDVVKRLNTNILSAVDYLDDGSPACAPQNMYGRKPDLVRGNYRFVFGSR